jgi:rare lipoprotein A (peptidoglycan hydrolase)
VAEENYARPTAKASWYDRRVCKEGTYGTTCHTANGEIFNDEAFTMACVDEFRFGDRVKLCVGNNCVTAVCTDRGAFAVLGRKFDLTSGVFSILSPLGAGVVEVEYEVIHDDNES